MNINNDTKRKVYPHIDAIMENCRQRNKFFQLIELHGLETTMTLMNLNDDTRETIREIFESYKDM